jgi:hypothetical protein
MLVKPASDSIGCESADLLAVKVGGGRRGKLNSAERFNARGMGQSNLARSNPRFVAGTSFALVGRDLHQLPGAVEDYGVSLGSADDDHLHFWSFRKFISSCVDCLPRAWFRPGNLPNRRITSRCCSACSSISVWPGFSAASAQVSRTDSN